MAPGAAERRLNAMGIPVHDLRDRLDEPDIHAFLLVTAPDETGRFAVYVHVKPGLEPDVREGVLGWAENRLYRYTDHGPELDGWAASAVHIGGWYLWCKEGILPDMSFLDG